MQVNIEALLKIAVQAGEAILKIYNQEEAIEVKVKADESPLTLADEASHQVIMQGLQTLYPEIPVLSEEGAAISPAERKMWEYYWCVDPLDGTKEFIRRNGEFTVNIALIHENHPVLGVIYVPVQEILYYGGFEMGAFKRTSDDITTLLQVDARAAEWISVGSRSHAAPEEAQILAHYPIVNSITAGSSLKFCLVAEGKAHIYYRHGPTMEWDTAAGQAVLEGAGGKITKPDGEPFLYNKENLLNGSFLCKVK